MNTNCSAPVMFLAPMPTFHGPVRHFPVKEFLFKFSLWGAAHLLTSQQLKYCLPLAIDSPTAISYFHLARNDIVDTAISWEAFSTSFLQNCPKDIHDNPSILEIFKTVQSTTEPSSVFVQRLLYFLDLQSPLLPAKDIVEGILPLLQPEVYHFLIMRGLPPTTQDLLDLCRAYDQSTLCSATSSSTPILCAATSTKTPLNYHSVSILPMRSRHRDRFCRNCGRSGHKFNRCWNLHISPS